MTLNMPNSNYVGPIYDLDLSAKLIPIIPIINLMEIIGRRLIATLTLDS